MKIIPKYLKGYPLHFGVPTWTGQGWQMANQNFQLVGSRMNPALIQEVTVKTNYKGMAKNKANKRNANVALLQDALWNIGAFNKMIDKKGKKLKYHKAVDGIDGPMTQQAIENAKKMGYSIDNGKLHKISHNRPVKNVAPNPKFVTTSSSNIPWISRNSYYTPTTKTNLLGVIEHKLKNRINDRYIYVNPNSGRMYVMRGANILEDIPIASGVNLKSDGWAKLKLNSKGKPIYDRSVSLSSTPAGIFTVGYSKLKLYNNEPSANLMEGKRGNKDATITQVALHGPATQDRENRLKKGENKLTYGCVLLPGGKMKCLYDKYGSLTGDSVYIEPTVEGNYIYEDVDGKLKTHFAETPSNVSGSVWGSNFNINNVRYNTGY